MIVVLALLDDIPIMTIAYDNVSAAPKPERWNMHRVLVFSCLMGLLVARRELRPAADRPRMDQRSGAAGAASARPAQPADHGVPAARGRRASAAVRGAHAPFGLRAALSERAVVPRHRRRPRSSRPDLRLRHSGAETAVGRDRRGLGLFARLDGRARYREADLLSRRRETRGPRARSAPPALPADAAASLGPSSRWRSRWISERSFWSSRDASSSSPISIPAFTASHDSEEDAQQELDRPTPS